MLIAGAVWMFAGTMVIRAGWQHFISPGKTFVKVLLSLLTFMVFYNFVFTKLVNKHHVRIQNDHRTKMNFWEFFDLKSYFIMGIMITGGIIIRKFSLLPSFVIGFFYMGIGPALFTCGIKFILKISKFNSHYL